MSMGDIHPPRAAESHREPDGDEAVGLAANPGGVPFCCGTCEYFSYAMNACQNPHPRLRGKVVERDWCCNLYHRPGMRVVVR